VDSTITIVVVSSRLSFDHQPLSSIAIVTTRAVVVKHSLMVMPNSKD